MGLIDNPGKIVGGSIIFDGKDVSTMTKSERQNLAGNEIAMIFQDPMTCLNPVFTIGNQIGGIFNPQVRQKNFKKGNKERSI